MSVGIAAAIMNAQSGFSIPFVFCVSFCRFIATREPGLAKRVLRAEHPISLYKADKTFRSYARESVAALSLA